MSFLQSIFEYLFCPASRQKIDSIEERMNTISQELTNLVILSETERVNPSIKKVEVRLGRLQERLDELEQGVEQSNSRIHSSIRNLQEHIRMIQGQLKLVDCNVSKEDLQRTREELHERFSNALSNVNTRIDKISLEIDQIVKLRVDERDRVMNARIDSLIIDYDKVVQNHIQKSSSELSQLFQEQMTEREKHLAKRRTTSELSESLEKLTQKVDDIDQRVEASKPSFHGKEFRDAVSKVVGPIIGSLMKKGYLVRDEKEVETNV
jgi:hypothetical protein